MTATNKLIRAENPGKKSDGATCLAVSEALNIVRDKWTILVLSELAKADALRYNELRRAVFGISQRMLTLTLKRLEENGLVTRTIFPTIPPRVDYALTPVGRTLVHPLRGLLDWSFENRVAMSEARAAYEKTTKERRHLSR